MAIETKLWDPAERLKTPEAELAYLEAAFEDGDPAVIAAAFGDIARARHDQSRQGRRPQPGNDVQGALRGQQPHHGDYLQGRPKSLDID